MKRSVRGWSKHGGSALAAVMMVIAIAILVAFTTATSSVFQITMAQQVVARTQARELAESAVAQGIAAVMNAEEQQVPVSPNLTVAASGPNSLSYLTFVKNNSLGLPWSCNNLASTGTTMGSLPGPPVPPACVQLIGTGRYGTATVQVEAIVHFPAFPYVVASSGSFQSPLGGVTVAEVLCQALLSSGLAGVSPCAIVPGDMLSNSTCQPAIQLGPRSLITGNVRASGSIIMSAGTDVKGDVEPYQAPAALPSVNVTQDPTAGYGGVTILSAPACSGPVTVTGLARATASLAVPGDLELDGALLFVNGDLTVGGALKGTGAVISTGKITVSGGAALTTTDMIALLAGGDVTLNGPSGTSAVFYGLVYTQGNLTANNLQLYGNFVANAPAGSSGGGNVTMNNCTLSFVANMVSLTMAGTVLTVTPGSSTTCPGSTGTPAAACGSFTITTQGLKYGGTHEGGFCCFAVDAATGRCMVPATYTITKCPAGGYNITGKGCNFWHCKCLNYVNLGCSGKKGLNGVCSSRKICFHKGSCGLPTFTTHMCCICQMCMLLTMTMNGLPTSCLEPNAKKALKAGVCALCQPPPPPACPNPPPPPLPVVVGPLQRVTPGTSSSCTLVFNFNFNQFISPADQMRLLLWQQVQVTP